ncbi:hypothetical protein ACFX14_036176 [Malus domestica]
MSPFPRNVILLVLVLFITSKTTNAWTILRRHVTVTIKNNLETKVDLKVHCKSADDDLGEHVIRPSENYEFKFSTTYFYRETLFFCGFTFSNQFQWFDIYKQNRDECRHCYWYVGEDGPCLDGTACLPWNPKE